jgi:mannosylglycoprotein endo-beta-mannosidase
VLSRKGLHGHFIKLIHACISTPSLSVIVNGQSYDNFPCARGIRKGCPLSPYLFVLAINELSILLQQSLSDAALSGIKLVPNCPPIHSLLFADGQLICGQATLEEAKQINHILHRFFQQSGQSQTRINLELFSVNLWISPPNKTSEIFFLCPLWMRLLFTWDTFLFFQQKKN